jgi:hypothetical protein
MRRFSRTRRIFFGSFESRSGVAAPHGGLVPEMEATFADRVIVKIMGCFRGFPAMLSWLELWMIGSTRHAAYKSGGAWALRLRTPASKLPLFLMEGCHVRKSALVNPGRALVDERGQLG